LRVNLFFQNLMAAKKKKKKKTNNNKKPTKSTENTFI
jgi:hypothetical protein